MHELDEGPSAELLAGEAEDPLPGGVQAPEVAVETGDREQVARGLEEGPQLLLGPPAFGELADLAPHGGEEGEKLLVGAADLAAEELEHADHFRAQQDREAEGRVQPHAVRDGRAREVRVLHDVRYPGRRPARPDAAGEADPGGEAGAPAHRFELRERGPRGSPDLDAAKHARPRVDAPERPVFPAQGLADGLQDPGRGVAQRGGLREGASGRVLRVQAADRLALREAGAHALLRLGRALIP